MRVIAGRFGGRRLKRPVRLDLRPTSDRVRESLFNILGPRVAGATVLDLFAGTGGLGIEALSRGASRAIFVERDRRAGDLIRRNLAMLGLGSGEAEVRGEPVADALAALAACGCRFDLVLADPPYGAGAARDTLASLARGGLVSPGGLAVLEHAAKESIPAPDGMILVDRRGYGDTALSFFKPAP
ncbi:MAG: 16S rRNA (guanine(966)-N(2))-methyltransferase RsmD [Patescibacteria group bacterium]